MVSKPSGGAVGCLSKRPGPVPSACVAAPSHAGAAGGGAVARACGTLRCPHLCPLGEAVAVVREGEVLNRRLLHLDHALEMHRMGARGR